MTRGLNSGHIGMDTDPEAEHWAGSIPLAGRGRHGAGGSRRVSLSGSARPVPTGTGRAWAASCFTTRYEAGFREVPINGLIYSMILNNPPERVFKREK